MTRARDISNLISGPVSSDRKTATPLIINGDMQIAQRGTSATALGNGDTGYHTVDRFKFREDGTPTYEFTMSQSTDTPTGQGFSQSLKLDCTTAQSSLASADSLTFRHIVEAQNLQMLKYGTSSAETLTLSFWVKTNKTGTYTLWVFQEDGSRNISKEYTVSSANTWEKKVINIDADTGGTINNDNGIGLTFGWYLGAGSDHTSGTLQTTWGSLVLANRVSSSQVNLADSTSNDWYITGVQLEVGTFDSNNIPDFQFEDITTSFNRCSRYFFRQYSNAPYSVFANGFISNSTTARVMQRFPRQRALATISTNGSFQVIEGGSSRAVSSIASDNNSRSFDGTRLDIAITLGSAGNGCMLRASNDTDAYIEADAEL